MRAGALSTLFVCITSALPCPPSATPTPRPPAGPANEWRRQRAGPGALSAPRSPIGCALRPARALPAGSRGGARTARGEGPRAAGGLQRGTASRPARKIPPARSRALSRRRRRRPPTPVCPGPRARRRRPGRIPAQRAGVGGGSTATSPARRARRRRTWRKGGLSGDPAMALDFLAGCAGGKEAGGARGEARGRREPESRGPEPCIQVGRSAPPSGLPSG